jgi:hypothetical protein
MGDQMAIKATFKHPRTGELKQVKVGFSWVLFFWSGLFGLPLFLRRLHIWGGIFLALWIVNLIGPMIVRGPDGIFLQGIIFFIMLLLQIWLGIKGNEMTAKNYLESGWEFVDPTDAMTLMAKGKWGIATA